jgi:hypothetical protein
MRLNVNTKGIKDFTQTLQALHRSALPSAVRGSLNKAAYDVKTKTMIEETRNTFEKRQPNFFKANSKFENAKGFDISTMKATAGFVSEGLSGSNNYAVKDLEQQEDGGSIDKKSFIPLRFARQGNNRNKKVRANARLSDINKIVDAKRSTGKTDKIKFVKAALHAGKGGFVLSNNILWKINSVKRLGGGNTVFNKTPLYSFLKGRKVTVKKTSFMETASLHTAAKIERFYVDEAYRQISKYKK